MLNEPHVHAVDRGRDALKRLFGRTYWIRTEAPLRIPPHPDEEEKGDPHPDLAVVEGARRTHITIPRTAVLVVEVAQATLREDRKKARRYAAAAIQEYWIVNLRDLVLEVHRDPSDGDYRWVRRLTPKRTLAPLASRGQTLLVSKMFPDASAFSVE